MFLEMKCPCCDEQRYADCCQPFHQAQGVPQTAEQLMRSRYSAYALNLPEYLYQTHHPDKRAASLQPIAEWATDVVFVQLEILATSQGQPGDKIGKVEFKAYYQQQDQHHVLHERSRFRRYGGKWVYWDGNILP